MIRANLVAGLLLLAMFLAGLTSGIVLQQLLTPDASAPASAFTPFPGPGGMRGRGGPGPSPGRFAPGVLTRRLDLSADQERAVEEIIREQQRQMDSLLMSIRPEIEEEFRALSERISEVLTPEQRAEFDRFVDEGFEELGARNPMGIPRGRPPFPMPR